MAQERTEIDYADRISRVIRHIADNLDQPLELDRLADIACFSRWHFHRIYRGVVGETADQTVRRLRLHRAAVDLLDSDRPLPSIAERAGYGSVEAFSRAFAASYGQPPAAYRAARNRVEQDRLLSVAVQKGKVMSDIALEECPARTLVGVDFVGPYLEIGAAFESICAWAGPRGVMGPSTQMIGVYYDDPDAVPLAEQRSFAGLTTENPEALQSHLANGVRLEALRAGPVARLRHKGPYAELHTAYKRLYGEWLPASGRAPADAAPFEIYLNSPHDTAPSDLLTDVYLPLAGD